MIACQYIPENKTALEFIAETAKEFDVYENKVCLIVPTERNLRYLAGCGFRYVDIFSLSSFNDAAIYYEKKLLPKELRPYYLLKAVQKLTKDEMYTVFKSSDEEYIESFLSFAQNSKNIFAFYRELFAENVTVEELSKAALYSDYESQITILNKLWTIYIELIHNDDYMDKWETYNNITYNETFISSYNKYIFLINGFLTKHELSFIKNISLKENVLVVFNYAGSLHAQHKEYEKFFNTSSLKDKIMPVLTNNNTQIYHCESNISQIELITKKAFEINKKHNIPFNKMAVVMPDTSCKNYFISLDVYKLFDVSAGDDAANTRIYAFLENLLTIYNEIQTLNMVSIQNIINLFADSFLLQIAEIKKINEDMYNLMDNNKLYIKKDDFIHIPFINTYLHEYFHAKEKATITYTINIYKSLLTVFHEIFAFESNIIHKLIILMDKLSTIYKDIEDIVDFNESSHLILSEIAAQTIDLPKREIAVTGILETRNMAYDVIFMPYMTEELFPPKSSKDLFINTEIRNQLNLPTYIDRENLMKDYCFQIMNHAKITIFSYSDKYSSIRRSSFIEELIIKYNLKVEYYAPKEISLIKTDKFYYNHTDGNIIIEKTDDVIEKLKSFTYSASALNIYRKCSLWFYFKYILKLEEESSINKKLDSQIFGIVLHDVFKELSEKNISACDENYTKEFQNEFMKKISLYDAYKYSKVEQFVAKIIYENIPQITLAEQNHAAEGFKLIAREKLIKEKFHGFNLIGYLDKVETLDNKIYVTDYKYKDESKIKPIFNNEFEKNEDIQLPMYAILIEKEMKKLPEELFYFSIKENYRYIPGFDMQLYNEYKKHIHDILKDIVSKESEFKQTIDEKNCANCPYTTICGRNNGYNPQ